MNTGPTGWIHYTNIGIWTDAILDRASITEYIQYGNGIDTAAHYHTFIDDTGRPLTCATTNGYVLRIPADLIPPAERFWS
jgi:hypothetical protein